MLPLDHARRLVGLAFDAVGLGPKETPHRVVLELAGARVRAYSSENDNSAPVLLIIPAPFKRAYIWDLMPEVSVVQRCLERGFRVYLLEWLVPANHQDGFGLAEYARSLPAAAIEAIEAETGISAPIVAGHSLGGTFAAIFATLFADRVGALILVDTPLAFGPHGGPFARVARAVPHARIIRAVAGSPIPGSAINSLSVWASPHAFYFQRLADLAGSMLDPGALAIHMRVERWTYDEFCLPGRLFEEILEHLYRENRFLSGKLQVGEMRTGIARLRAPVMAVVNNVGHVVPPLSMIKGLNAAAQLSFKVLEYNGDYGPMIQHVGPLVARIAHEQLWPKILDWATEMSGNLALRKGSALT